MRNELPTINSNDDIYSSDSDNESLDYVPSDASGPEVSDEYDVDAEDREFLEQKEAAVQEIEDDFDRLLGRVNGGGEQSSGDILDHWDFSFTDRESSFDIRDDLRAVSGLGRRKKNGRSLDPEMSHQVKIMMIEANNAYVEGRLEDAIAQYQEIIRIDPRQYQPWSVIAQCHQELGEPEKALQLEIVGAHLRHDSDIWKELGQRSRDMGFLQQALYCYRKVARLNPKSVDAIWDRAVLLKEVGFLREALNNFLAILKMLPHNLQVLNETRQIVVELSDIQQGVSLYLAAFEYYRSQFPEGANDIDGTAGGFGDGQLLVLADLLQASGDHEKVVEVLRSGTRWLQGRRDETFWDMTTDDREFDLLNVVRSPESGTTLVGHYPMDINLRHRLGIARLMLGDIDEGKIHAHAVLSCDIHEFSVLFLELADAFFDAEQYGDALAVYEQLAQDEMTNTFHVMLRIGACYRRTDQLDEAIAIFQQIIDNDNSNTDAKMQLAEIYEINNQPAKALDLVYQVIDSRNRDEAAMAIDNSGDANEPVHSLFAERKSKTSRQKTTSSRLSAADLQRMEEEREADTQSRFKSIRDLRERVDNGEEEAIRTWLLHVSAVVEGFRSTRQVFSINRHAHFQGMERKVRAKGKSKKDLEADQNDMASRLEIELGRHVTKANPMPQSPQPVSIFRGVHFDEWLALILRYSLMITTRGHYSTAEEVLRHITVSNAFQDSAAQDAIRLSLLACAMHAGEQQHVVEHLRRLFVTHQFNNEVFRLLPICLAPGRHGAEAFIDTKLQKFLNRTVRFWEAALSKPGEETSNRSKPELRYSTKHGRWLFATGERDEEDSDHEGEGEVDSGSATQVLKPPKPTVDNPVGLTLYSQVLLAAKSYQTAIFYLLECSRILPHDPMIQLLSAISFSGRAMQRQVDNRHQLVVQGLANLDQYRKLRRSALGNDDMNLVQQEIEYNFGRWFHQLGLLAYAVKHYQKVLDLSEIRDGGGFAKEAAFNLSLIYTITGALDLVRVLHRRWLSV